MKDDGEFRGTTKQAIHDLTSRFDRFEDKFGSQVQEIGARFDGKLDAVVKVMVDKEDRYNGKFALSNEVIALDDQVKVQGEAIQELKQWRFYILGGMSILTGVILFFGDTIRKAVLGQ